MARIAGVDIPREKRVEIALTYVFGIGRTRSLGILEATGIDPAFAELRRLKSPRPGHADLAGGEKYLRRDLRDILERASARETTARVAAGAFAKMLLARLGV